MKTWPKNDQMEALAELFPSMRNVPGAHPLWDAEDLIRWCNSGAPTGGSRWAARFLLMVWNGQTDWTTTDPALRSDGKFDLWQAWSVWDDAHRAAALTWLRDPFWP